jgi:hypothetical protein
MLIAARGVLRQDGRDECACGAFAFGPSDMYGSQLVKI